MITIGTNVGSNIKIDISMTTGIVRNTNIVIANCINITIEISINIEKQ